MHHRAVFPPGTVVAGKYRVERELGVGGMGAVYVAVNEVLRKRVALKVMSRLLDAQPHGVERFFLEAMTASRVRHPAIVEIYDAGRTDDGAPWMAMELLDGESLRGRLERGPLSLGEVLPIFLPLLDALGAVHQQGIVHRDLKPDNIFLERLPGGSLQPKLLDFGIAKNAHAIEKLTRAGSVMGTPDYLAPEQARDSSAVDSRTDLYAMGVVLYVALSGRVPFEATTLPELLLKLVTEDPKPLLAVAPMVPADLANIVHWCLARDPDARPQRAVDLSHHLGRVLEGIPSAAPGNAAAALARARTAPSGARQRGDVGHLGIAPTRSVLPASEPPSFGPPPRPRVAPTQPMDGAGPVDRPATAASSAPAHSSGPESPRRKSHAGLLLGLAGVAVLVVGCVFVAPLVVSLLIGVASVGIAAGGAGGGQAWSPVSTRRFWDSWRMPFIVDVDGDGADDVIGWSRRIVGTDMHSELCAFRGADGEVIWCADVGERDDLSEEETVLLGDRIVHFDARGQISAFGLRDGESLGWQSSVRGEPEEVCALEPGVLAVRTPDRLWSTVSARDGRAVLLGEQAPGTCTPPPH
ncbi:MAG TPA: serine/threonine protein kinase, partial [Polyangiaceae bacterium]|nr:serine/threonine protein kinase [Polyangiaceae bacterium]